MLKNLKIQNLILVDKAEVSFHKGLNIITGETGAGKSAILAAIGLISGQRADTEMIGKSADLAIVEAELEADCISSELFEIHKEKTLIIRREIHKSGKNRIFINDALISLQELKTVTANLIEMIAQSSALDLFDCNEQKYLLDLFAENEKLLKTLQKDFSEQQVIEKKLADLMILSKDQSRDLSWFMQDLEIIEKVNWRCDEEEHLQEKHKILVHAGDLLSHLSMVSECLHQNPLKKVLQSLELCGRIDSKIVPLAQTVKSLGVDLQEVLREVDNFMGHLDLDPTQIQSIENRMSQIDQLKRRFGKSFREIEEKKQFLQESIARLNNLEDEIKHLSIEKEGWLKKNQGLADILRENRKHAAIKFANQIESELKSLNLPGAKFSIVFTETPLGPSGIDAVEFLFSANVGHSPISLEKCASGGELSRLLFAIKTILVDKEKVRCLIFDEIDSNVGGQTASVLGEKLKKMASQRQIICITHFVQVAKVAEHHFKVQKDELHGKTISRISKLCDNDRPQEYERMLGL